jgi:hypothetical protein
MAKPRSGVLELTKRGAAIEYRALVDELKFLLDMFPHLRDSYDPDELPVSFIMKRDATKSRARTGRRGTPPRKPAPTARRS